MKIFRRETHYHWFVVGFIALLLGGFLKLSAEILEGDDLIVQIDRALLLFFARLRIPYLNIMAVDFTALGSTTVLTLLVVTVAALSLMKRDRAGAAHMLAGGIGAAVLSYLLKGHFERSRPEIVDRLLVVTGYSYPSGHTLASSAVYFTLAAVTCRYFRQTTERAGIFTFAVFLVCLIGVSRVYLGVHYPSDVLAGALVGTAWAFLLAAFFPLLTGRKKINA